MQYIIINQQRKDDLFINGVRTTGYSFGKDNKVKLLVETKINSRWIKYVNRKTKKRIIEILLDVEIL